MRATPSKTAVVDATPKAGAAAGERSEPITDQTDAGPGLVLCATTVRPCEELEADAARWARLVESAWSPAFPSPDLVDVAAGMFTAQAERIGPVDEGPRWRIHIGPGVVRVGTKDYARRDRAEQRAEEDMRMDVDQRVAWFLAEGDWPSEPDPQREIHEWSRKSRARMVRTLCELDYTPLYLDEDGQRRSRLPAMVTLTYPGDWLTVAPNGKAAQAHLARFRKRYARAWNEPLAAVWKLEFQRRGAPHFHLLTVPPHGVDAKLGLPFPAWLSHTWAEIVAHPEAEEYSRHLRAGTGIDYAEGLRARDPRRVAVYFLKHNVAGDKEYQHEVPEEWREPGAGPGRFWGYWQLCKATATVQVDPEDAIVAARTMRRWSRAQQRTRQVTRPRVDHSDGPNRGRVRYRKSRERVVLVPRSKGWVAVPDGPAFAAELARYLDQRRCE